MWHWKFHVVSSDAQVERGSEICSQSTVCEIQTHMLMLRTADVLLLLREADCLRILRLGP